MLGMFISAGVMGCGIDSATSAQAFDANILPALIGLLGVLLGVFITGLWSYFIAKINYRNQLRLAALDKRLAAHQEAYLLCYELYCKHKSSGDERDKVQKKCEDWFLRNCLYLGPRSNSKFNDLLHKFSTDTKISFEELNKKYVFPTLKALKAEMAFPSPSLEKDVVANLFQRIA
jgi:hypothetical protein